MGIMAKLSNMKVYERIEAGATLVSIPASAMPALKAWLFYHGYSWKTNRNGDTLNVMVTRK